MKFPWQKSEQPQSSDPADQASETASAVDSAEPTQKKGYTPPKGRPTPKRREVEMERGVIRGGRPNNPQVERQQRKELKKSMSKEEWKEHKRQERQERVKNQKEAQAAMDRGDERYLLPRDQGPERALARDYVDSRRYLINWFMPAALVMLVTMFVSSSAPQLAQITSLVMMLFMLIFILEGLWVGRSVNKAVREKFPDTTETGFRLGFYGFSRATQPRRWRTPKPRVELGSWSKPKKKEES